MSYPVEYRKRVLEYIAEGNKQVDAIKIFKVSRTAIHEWKKQLEETGTLEGKEITRPARLFKSEELLAYVEAHPFATLAEIAAHFGGSTSGAHDALKREGISLKKDTCGSRTR